MLFFAPNEVMKFGLRLQTKGKKNNRFSKVWKKIPSKNHLLTIINLTFLLVKNAIRWKLCRIIILVHQVCLLASEPIFCNINKNQNTNYKTKKNEESATTGEVILVHRNGTFETEPISFRKYIYYNSVDFNRLNNHRKVYFGIIPFPQKGQEKKKVSVRV